MLLSSGICEDVTDGAVVEVVFLVVEVFVLEVAVVVVEVVVVVVFVEVEEDNASLK